MIEINMLQINVFAVLVATIASFILGMAWYAKLFAKSWAKGGETALENLQTLCSVCNIGKSDLE